MTERRLETPEPPSTRGWLGRCAPYLVIAFLYLATSPYHRGLNNPNEMVRVYMTKAMVDHDTVAIDTALREWGMVDDKATRDGHLYSSKAPLQSLVGVPAYAAYVKAIEPEPPDKRTATRILRLFGAALPGLLFAGILLAWFRKRSAALGLPQGAGTALGMAVALGTMLYPYAITYTGHILAAATAGGCFLALWELLEATPGTRRWRQMAILAGFCGGAAPFAEYPAALVAAPALVGAFIMTPTARGRGALFGWLAVGGAAPFSLGLWAHHVLWGAPWKTGYSFLENKAYVQVHGSGFFGVGAPQPQALAGALFSPGTGLFFFSPLLLLGLIAILAYTFGPPGRDDRRMRGLAIMSLVGFVAEVLFISGHNGWRGGWTVGPRYIIPVAPLLGVWVVQAMRWRWAARLAGPLAALSVAATGFAAALYPHLSDVYTNPLVTFLWPSYLRGEFSYGLAHDLGMTGHAANVVHLLPLVAVFVFVGVLGNRRRLGVDLAITGLAAALFFGGISLVSEVNASAALKENERLWGFWEPARPRERRPGLVYHARERYRLVRVEAQLGEGRKVACKWSGRSCTYGGMGWQRFGPDFLQFAGKHEPVLHVHPISNWTVRLRFSVPPTARAAVLTYGLTDGSVDSTNPEPVNVKVKVDQAPPREVSFKPQRGLQTMELTLGPGPSTVIVELTTTRDGARVMGLDLEAFETPQ